MINLKPSGVQESGVAMSLQILGAEPRRAVLVGVVAPLLVVGPLFAVGLTDPPVGLFGLIGATMLGAALFMAIAQDQRAEFFAARSTRGQSAAFGIDGGAKPVDEQNPVLSRVVGTLMVFGAGLASIGLLTLALFLVLV